MAQANGSAETGEHTMGERGASVGRLLAGRLLQQTGFWSAVGLPFVAVVVLAMQPPGWLPLLVGLFVANGVAAVAGHCYGREC